MRANITNIWFGSEESHLTEIFKAFLSTPGNHPALASWYQVAQGEPLAFLYDVWSEAIKNPAEAYNYMSVFMEQYNVMVGEDVVGEVSGAELFYSELTEVCEAVDTWIATGQLASAQAVLASKASDYYRSIRGVNLGAINVIRGWYELLQVITGKKQIIRCIATDCNKLVMLEGKEVLSGTADGYHSKACQKAHTESPDEALTLEQLPGVAELQEVVGDVREGVVDGDTPEDL